MDEPEEKVGTVPGLRRALAALLALTLQAAACGPGGDARGPAAGAAARAPHDLLLVTLDTARADRFSYAGPSPVDTPVADSLAREGAAFLAALAPSPITLVSHASLFTGQEPPRHGVRNNGEFALAAEAMTLAELLGERGWRTAAFVGAAVLDARYGLDQGFETYDDAIDGSDAAGMFSYARRSGDRVVEAALDWLAGAGRGRTFVWVHLYDPHAPYLPPEPERSRYAAHPYDGAIAFSDRVVGRLLDGYRRSGRLRDTLVVLTADHGESLGEHGESTHGVFIYDATVRIPLVVRGPGIAAGTRVHTPVSLIDVMPTVLSAVGIEPPATVTGLDLGPLLRGETSPAATHFLESLLPRLSYGWSPLYGLRTERWKLIRGVAPELYDLQADPAELVDLAAREPEVVRRLSRDLAARLEVESPATARELEVDAATRRQLAALGYVSAPGADRAAAGGEELPDPRRRIAVMERMNAAMSRFSEGDEGGGIADLERIVAAEPGNLAAAFNLAQLRFRSGDYAGAAEAYGAAAELAPADARYREYQGLALERAGRLEEGLVALERALAIEPDRAGARALRWRLLAALGRTHELLASLEAAVADDPGDGAARVMLLRARFGAEPGDELIAALAAAHRELPRDPAVASALAHALQARGDSQAAEPLYRQVLEQIPGDHDSSLFLGRRALARGDAAQARRILEAGVRKHPDRSAMQIAVAQARLASGDFPGANRALAAAERLDPRSPDLWLTGAELRIRENRADEAWRALERAAALGRPAPELWRQLSALYRRSGRAEEAARAARRAEQP